MHITQPQEPGAARGSLRRGPSASSRHVGQHANTLPERVASRPSLRTQPPAVDELDPILAAWAGDHAAANASAIDGDVLASVAGELRTLALAASSPTQSDTLMRASSLLDEHAALQRSVHANRMALLQG